LKSGFEAEGEFFDDGVGEDFARDALDFTLCLGEIGGKRVVESEQEVLTLADVGDAFVFHAAERTGDGLALRVEHGPLQCHVYMGLHLTLIIDGEDGFFGDAPSSYRLEEHDAEALTAVH
jgi:hypothetical protein